MKSLLPAALALATLPALAARPMITDDARIVDAKACQVESWVRSNREGPGSLWAFPACNPTGNLELTAGGGLSRDEGREVVVASLVQAKTLFKPLESNGWGIGLALGRSVDRPAGQARAPSLYAYVPVSWSLRDDAVVMHLNLGLRNDRSLGHTHGTWGLGSEIRLRERLQLVAETFGESGSRPFAHGGLRWWLVPERVQVDATLGTQLERGTSQRWVSIGVRLLSPAFLP